MTRSKKATLKVVPNQEQEEPQAQPLEPQEENSVMEPTAAEDDLQPVNEPIPIHPEPKRTVTRKDLQSASLEMHDYFFSTTQKKPGVDGRLMDMGTALNVPFKIPYKNPQGFYIVRLLFIGPDAIPSGLTDPMGNPLVSKSGYSIYPGQAVGVGSDNFGKLYTLDFEFYMNLAKGNHQHDRSWTMGGITYHVIRPHEILAESTISIFDALQLGLLKLEHLRPNEAHDAGMRLMKQE